LIASSFSKAAQKSVEFLEEMGKDMGELDLNNKDALVRAATTSLGSKVRNLSISERKRQELIVL
jgi:chaperonin GroEL (HSP60 family)